MFLEDTLTFVFSNLRHILTAVIYAGEETVTCEVGFFLYFESI